MPQLTGPARVLSTWLASILARQHFESEPNSGIGLKQSDARLLGYGKPRRAWVNEDVFDPGDTDKMMQRLEELRERHRDLDAAIERLELDGGQDFKIMGLKREKLRVKDRIVWLSSKLTPDIIA